MANNFFIPTLRIYTENIQRIFTGCSCCYFDLHHAGSVSQDQMRRKLLLFAEKQETFVKILKLLCYHKWLWSSVLCWHCVKEGSFGCIRPTASSCVAESASCSLFTYSWYSNLLRWQMSFSTFRIIFHNKTNTIYFLPLNTDILLSPLFNRDFERFCTKRIPRQKDWPVEIAMFFFLSAIRKVSSLSAAVSLWCGFFQDGTAQRSGTPRSTPWLFFWWWFRPRLFFFFFFYFIRRCSAIPEFAFTAVHSPRRGN